MYAEYFSTVQAILARVRLDEVMWPCLKITKTKIKKPECKHTIEENSRELGYRARDASSLRLKGMECLKGLMAHTPLFGRKR